MNNIVIAAPFIIFMLFVAPIWLMLHYRSKREINEGLTKEEFSQLNELSELADKMTDRVRTLEAILDVDSPDWRNKE